MVWQFLGIKVDRAVRWIWCEKIRLIPWELANWGSWNRSLPCKMFSTQIVWETSLFALVRHSGACAVCLGNCKCSWMKTHSSLRSGRQHSFLLSLGPVELRWNESAETFNGSALICPCSCQISGESIAEALTHRQHSGIHATTASVLVTSRMGTYDRKVSNPHIELKLPEMQMIQVDLVLFCSFNKFLEICFLGICKKDKAFSNCQLPLCLQQSHGLDSIRSVLPLRHVPHLGRRGACHLPARIPCFVPKSSIKHLYNWNTHRKEKYEEITQKQHHRPIQAVEHHKYRPCISEWSSRGGGWVNVKDSTL